MSTAENTLVKLSKKDFETPNDVRWCPGCGDYSILAAVQKLLPELNIPQEKFMFVSGIGCSSRFPYYMNTYGFHTIHGRAPAFATGIKITNPELSVWMITGDGDALSIGGNHFMHALRRNIDINLLLFNNRIYGLTKGQYSPTSQPGTVTKSSPIGSVDHPVNPLALALGADASFVARTVDVDAKHMIETFRAAENHRGTSFVEIFQNCVIFNDDTFKDVVDRSVRADAQIHLEHGKLMIFGKERNKGLKLNGLKLETVEFEAGNEAQARERGVMVHDSGNRELAHLLARNEHPAPMGVLYQEQRPTFDSLVRAQITDAKSKIKVSADKTETLRALYHSGDTWAVS